MRWPVSLHGTTGGATRNRGLAILAWAALFTLSHVSSAAAQGGVVEVGGGRYFGTFWLIMLIVQCTAWMGTFDWVGRDTEQLKGRTRFWCTLLMGLGAAGTFLMLVVHMAFVVAALLGLFVTFGIYVWQRNQGLPPERRVFTRQHLSYVLRTAAERLRLRRTAGAVIRTPKRGADTPGIVLLRKDGASLEKLTKTRGTTAQASDAIIAVKELIESAILSRATDIHLEPKEGELQGRFRIDGILHSVPSYPVELALPMISGVKVLADMDIAEKRKPQDGTFMGRIGERALDFRVATTPSVHGETMVIRVLDRDIGLIRLDRIGLPSEWQATIRRIIHSAHGMVVASGPTGSGKTTTVYAMLCEMDAFQKNIVTVENPIEYRLDNVTQTQVNPKAGVTFASALRSFLRQDPDVIMVGEVRDAETARVALQAAMTGHSVITTLHANDAITSLFRLLDLGIEPYLISSSLTAVLGQRLVRLLCPNCKVPYIPRPAFLRKIGVDASKELQLYKAQGCEECQGTGYKGRRGVFDLFELNDVIRELIRTNPSLSLIKQEARKAGWRTIQETGLKLVIEGSTCIKELVRTTK